MHKTHNRGGKKWIFKKIRAILVPQITLGIISIITIIFFDVIVKRSIGIGEIDCITPLGNWFLPVLFIMELMVVPIITIVDNRKIQTVLTAIVFVIFYYVSYKEIQYVQQVLAASVFCLFGYVTRPWLDKFATGNYRFIGFGWIALIIVAILSTMNETVGMYINQYGNKVMFLLTGIIGIYAIYDFSISLKNTSFIQWCGRQSIIIYILQFALIRFVIALQGMLSSNFCFDVYPSYMVTFIIVLTLLVPITKFCDKYLKFAFGK